jgi:mono/diheme cytochrome c family protein
MERKVTMSRKHLLAFALAAVTMSAPLSFSLFAQPKVAQPRNKAQAKPGASKNSSSSAAGQPGQSGQSPPSQTQDEGQRIFEANCSRCHNAPEGFSPRISGTVVHHMRVRANLSKHDEEELLKFFNP